VNPYWLWYSQGYGAGIYGMSYSRYDNAAPPSEPVASSDERPSAPGTYMPNALTLAQPEAARSSRVITLLALKDGTMYGVIDYWLDRGVLHYIPSYGGENTLPLEGVDINKTVELNSAKGIGFVLRSSPAIAPAPSPQ
jgi:hypothetical protein